MEKLDCKESTMEGTAAQASWAFAGYIVAYAEHFADIVEELVPKIVLLVALIMLVAGIGSTR